jgi:plasmid stabilization system protein ParE
VKIVLTARARRRAAVVTRWWRANRPRVPELFDEELGQALRNVAREPDLGRPYETVAGDMVRRVLLPKSEQFLYYSVDAVTETVIVLTLWGARRGRVPRF